METVFLLQLMMTTGIGYAAIKKIIHYSSVNAEISFERLRMDPMLLKSIINCESDTVMNILKNEDRAKKLFDEMQKKDIAAITEADTAFPVAMKEALKSRCPPILFISGNQSLLSTQSVGFCGSRKVSPKGVQITEQCAAQLASQGITVVSGYAAGTDLAAHRSAMEHGGKTVFVLAEGLLKCRNKPEIRDLITPENHVFVSQFQPNQVWSVWNAMNRNSIIIGLSSAMILVESGKTGGTFAAGEESLKRGVPLFVIDYEKPELSAEANPYFIQHGGMPIRGRNGIPNLDRVYGYVEREHTYNRPEQLRLNI